MNPGGRSRFFLSCPEFSVESPAIILSESFHATFERAYGSFARSFRRRRVLRNAVNRFSGALGECVTNAKSITTAANILPQYSDGTREGIEDLASIRRTSAPKGSYPMSAHVTKNVICISIGEKLLLTIPEAAAMMSTTVFAVRELCRSGALKYVPIGHAWLISPEAIRAYIRQQELRVA
jgi:hypothetical protein